MKCRSSQPLAVQERWVELRERPLGHFLGVGLGKLPEPFDPLGPFVIDIFLAEVLGLRTA